MTLPIECVALGPAEYIITGDERLLEWRRRHQMKVPGAEFTPRYRKGHWDGTWSPGKWLRRVGDKFEFRCSRGLVPRVVRDFGGEVEFGLVDDDVLNDWLARTPRIAELRDYQHRALTQVLQQGWGRVAFATNAGKGAVIALLARYAADIEQPCLILCDELAVFDALRGEIETWADAEPTLINAGIKEPPMDSSISLAMVPTLSRRLGEDGAKGKAWRAWAKRHTMVLLDEADKAGADTWRAILDCTPESQWRAGFSGTFGTDLYKDLVMDELMGPVTERIKNKEMVERGVSAKPLIEAYAFNATASLPKFPDDWWALPGPTRRLWTFECAVVYNRTRHEFIRGLIQPDTSTVIIINRLDHGPALADIIPGSVFLEGSTAQADRIEALEAFQRGEVRVLIVTKILDRGSNRLGHAADIIFASGEGSATQTLQRIGRGLRRGGGKEFLRLVDIIDRVDINAKDKKLLNAAAFLHAAAKRRVHVYAQEGFELRIIPQGGV